MPRPPARRLLAVTLPPGSRSGLHVEPVVGDAATGTSRGEAHAAS